MTWSVISFILVISFSLPLHLENNSDFPLKMRLDFVFSDIAFSKFKTVLRHSNRASLHVPFLKQFFDQLQGV